MGTLHKKHTGRPMGHLFRGLLLASALTGVLNSAAWAADAALLNSARNLISAGEAREAFNLLAQHEKAEAGTYDFDYLYGLSALEAGMPQLAIFALERALARAEWVVKRAAPTGKASKVALETERQF